MLKQHIKLYDKTDDFDFYIVNFPSCLATFQVYVSQLIRYDTPMLELTIRILLIESCSGQKKFTESGVSQVKIRVITPDIFRTPS